MRCAYCHDAIDELADICTGCQTGLHPECWDEAQRCPTLGCERTPTTRGSTLGKLIIIVLGSLFLYFLDVSRPRTVGSGSCCFSWRWVDPSESDLALYRSSFAERLLPPRSVPSFARGRGRERYQVQPDLPQTQSTAPDSGQVRIRRGPRRRRRA